MQTEIQSAKCLSAEELSEVGELLGEILLTLQSPLAPEEQQGLWQCLELLLERYVEGKKKSAKGKNAVSVPVRDAKRHAAGELSRAGK